MSGALHGKSVLVTGGTGFIGRHLVDALLKQGADVSVMSRHAPSTNGQRYKTITGDLARPDTLEGVCQGRDIVFHLGGYAHAVDEYDGKGEEIHRQVTVEGTRSLVNQALQSNVHRFVFFSSVKAMGEGDEARFDESAPCRPVTAYGKAKYGAENIVLEAGRRGLPLTIFRLPVVYGPGCRGNLSRMIQAVARGRFPPLPETNNKLSMVDVRDVVRAALLVAGSPAAAGKMYLVTDGQAYSTRQIYEWICAALHRSVPRWVIPLFLLRFAAHVGDVIGRLTGRRFVLDTDVLDKLIGSAWYSAERISRELGYRPVYGLKDVLPEMVVELRKSS